MRILGLDPGTATTGYGVIDTDGNRAKAVDHGAVYTSSEQPLPQRVLSLFEQISSIMDRWRPDAVAVEEVFFNRNVRSALAVGQARGTLLLAAAQRNIPVFSYTPLEVKMALTGQGRAPKEQVGFMVRALLRLPEIPRPDDAADALALAVCCWHKQPWDQKVRQARAGQVRSAPESRGGPASPAGVGETS
ncbi:MAG: crossover junction endodeoxyribonuclease RuvC [Firmicutes bacterium]|nr:crossover junction endodeoxyribonuclease RuvC [Bacillota bacterium]